MNPGSGILLQATRATFWFPLLNGFEENFNYVFL